MIANDPYAELERRFARLSAVNRAGAILNWDRSTMMPDGASEDRADQLATLGVDRPRDDRRARHARPAVAGGGGQGGARSLAGGQPARDAPRPGCTRTRCRPISSRRARAPRSACEHGLARGQEERRLQVAAADPHRGADHHAPRRRGQGRGARHLALRRAARRIRAGRPLRAHRPAVRRAARPSCRTCSAACSSARRAEPEPLAARRAVPGRGAAPAGRGADPPHRLRLPPRPARRLGASLHRRHRRRRAHHHALRRGRLRARPDGRAARDRPRALRGRPAARLAPPAGRQCARHGAAREPVAADGDAGLPQPTPSSPSPPRACARPSARSGPAWTEDNIHRLYTRVAPGFIRVDADEVTYPLHIMLRYRLERAMLAGDLALADLPGAWNDGMRELAGHRAAGRCAGLPAGHPLAGRRLGLFPDLHAGRAGGGPALRRRAPGRPGPAGGDRARAISRRCWAGCGPMCTARARSPRPTRS